MNGTRSHRRRKRGRRMRRKDTNAKVACNYVHATEITRLEPWSPCFPYLRDLHLREMLPPWIDWLVVAKIETIWRPTRWRFSLKCSFLDFLDFLTRIRVCMFTVLRTFFFVSSFRNIDMYICIIIYVSFCLFVYDTYNNIRYTLIHCIYITRYIYSLNIYNLFII